MESIIRGVSALDDAQRHTLEHVIGRELRENQRLVIQVVNLDLAPESPSPGGTPTAGRLPDWCNVYEGLSEQQIEEIDKIAKTRANLTRDLP